MTGTLVLWLVLAILYFSAEFANGSDNRRYAARPQEKPEAQSPITTTTQPPATNISICLLTYFDGGGTKLAGKVGQIVIDNKKRYCEIHGYRFIHASTTLDESRSASWVKLLHVQQQLLNPACDWLFFMDADTLITNRSVTLESIIGANRKEDVIYPSDPSASANGGIFLIKRSPYSITYLTRVYGHTEFLNSGWWEQSAIQKMLGPEMSPQDKGRIAIIPQRKMNSFWGLCSEQPACKWHRGDFVAHFAGRPVPRQPQQWNVTQFIEQNRDLVFF